MSKFETPYTFIKHTGWLDIPDLFKEIKSLNRGQQHQLVVYLEKIFQDDWWNTITYNHCKCLVNYKKYAKSLGINSTIPPVDKKVRKTKFAGTSRHRMTAQGIGDLISNLTGAVTDIKSSVQSGTQDVKDMAREFTQEASAFIKNANQSLNVNEERAEALYNASMNMSNRIEGLVDTTNDLVTKFHEVTNILIEKTSAFSVNSYLPALLHVVCKFIALGYLLSIPSNQNLKSVLALLVLIVPLNWSGLYSFANNLFRAIQGLVQKVVAQDGCSDNLIIGFFDLIKSILQSLFSTVSDDKFRKMSLSSNRLRVISDTIRSSTTIVEFISNAVTKILQTIGDKCLKYKGYLPWFARDRSLEPLIDEYEKIKLEHIEEKCQMQKTAARRIIQLLDALVAAEAKVHKQYSLNGTNAKIAPYLRLMIKNLSDMVAKIPDHFRTGKNPRRVKPFWVYIYGEPRIGKSALLQPYIVNALAKSLEIIPSYEDYTNYTYFRNCGDEYWEGYYGHDVLWYNDLFQNHADEPAMHKAVLELTNVIDDNLFPLNMAFERKHGVYFDSELVVSNAQDDIINAGFIKHKCWSGGSHLFARRNVVLEFTLNPKYAHPSKVGYDESKVSQEMIANPDECFGKTHKLFPNDMYIINVRNPIKGTIIAQYDFEHTIEYLTQVADQFKRKQNVFKDKLYDEFAGMWAQSDEIDQEEMRYRNFVIDVVNKIASPRRIVKTQYLDMLNNKKRVCRMGRLVLDVDKLPFQVPNDSLAQDMGIWIADMFSFNAQRSYSTIASSLIGILSSCELNSVADIEHEFAKQNPDFFLTNQDQTTMHNPKFYTRGDEQTIRSDEIEETFYDASSLEQDIADAYIEPISAEIRKMFPDLCGSGWTEEFKDFVSFTIPVPNTRNGARVGVKGQAMQFSKYFTGTNLSSGQKCRVILSVEAIGYKLFDNMSIKGSKTFCQKARDCVRDIGLTIRNVVMSNEYLQAFMIGLAVTAAYMSLLTILARVIGSSFKPKFEIYDLPSLQMFKEKIEQQIAIRQNAIQSVAQTAEGSQKAAVKQVKRIVKKGIAQAYDSQNVALERILASHVCKFGAYIKHEGQEQDRRMYGSGLCVAGDVFVVPDHFVVRWHQMKKLYDKHGDQFVITLYWNEKQNVDLDWEALSFYKLPYEHSDDVCFVRVKNLIQMRNLSKFFCKVDDTPSLFECYLFGRRSGGFNIGTTSVQRTELSSQIYTHPERIDCLYGEILKGREIIIPQCYKYYDTRTINGDCGVLLLNSDSKMNCRKIMGMHTAGETYSAISSIIYQEDILEAIEHFSKISLVYQLDDELDPVTDCYAQELEELGLDVIGQLPDINEPGYKVKRQPKICLPRKTKIQKSVVHDIMAEDYGATTLAPAKLRPFKKQDQVISPLHLGLKKMIKQAPMVSVGICNKITKHMARTIKSWHSPYVDAPRLLSDDEIVNGFGNIKPIEMQTSPGYPYVQLDNTAGKTPFFVRNNDKWEMGELVKSKLDKREQDAKLGIVTPTLFIASLKDETRPLEKVQAGKTRLFQISPMDFNMLLRKYFGFFVAHCHATCLIGEMAVGINANSYEWGLLLKKMKEVGNKFVNGDGEAFDASTGQTYSMYNVEVVNEFYNDGPINARVRRVLYITFLNARNIIGRLVFIVRQGNMSGIWITTIFNNMTGMFCVRFTFIRIGYDLNDFDKFIRNTHYGDDDLICVHDFCVEFTFQTHADTMLLMGIKYTTATKKDITETYFAETEISFLKRAFYKEEGIVFARLPMDVILEIPRWSESDPTKMDDQMNRFNSALLEISNYGRAVYNQISDNFERYCYAAQGLGFNIKPTHLFSYERCYEIKFPNLVGEHPHPCCDLAGPLLNVQVLRNKGGSGSETLSTIGEFDCCIFTSYNTTANYESQSAEGSTKPPVKQVVRIIKGMKTQSEDEVINDFQCEMFLMEKLKEMAPLIQSIYDYSTHQISQTAVRHKIRRLCNATHLLYLAYRNCTKSFAGTEMETQGEETGNTITNERKENPATEDGVTAVTAGGFVDGDDVVDMRNSTFINDNIPHQPTFNTRVIRKDYNNIRDISLEQFYQRPYLIEEFKWSSGNDLKLLKTYEFPKVLYDIPALKSKLENIKYARPDIEVEFMINGTAFHYGTLTMCVVPYPKFVSNAYLQVHSVTTWPQWYSITAGADQNLRFTIPYRSMSHTQPTTSSALDNWAGLYVYVTAPLTSVSSATPAAVGVSVFARLVKPQLNGMYSQGEEQTLSVQGVTTNSGPQGPISSGLTTLGRCIDAVKPLVHSAGWSIPVNTASTTPMQVRFPMFSKIDDLPCSQVLGPSQLAKLDHDLANVNAQFDEMDFDNFVNHPSLIQRTSWLSTTASGAVLVNRPVDQGFFTNTQGSSASVAYFTPLGYLLNAHMYWRGGVKVCIRVVASRFHAGRLRVLFVPTGSTSTITLENSVNFRNITIDINGTTDTVFELPFDYVKPWIASNEAPFTLKVIVINPLTSGATDTPQPVYLQVYAWGAQDFQLAYPNVPEWRPDLRFVTAPTMVTQGEEITPCKLSATSADCLKNVKPIWLGDTDRRQKVGNCATSFVYRSIKQACNLLSPITRYTTDTADKISNVALNPLYGTNDIAVDNEIWNCPLIYYRSIYTFGRGGYRVVCLTDEDLQVSMTLSDTSMSASIASAITKESTPLWQGSPLTLQDLSAWTYPFAFFRNSSLSPPDVTIPYFSSSVCSLLGNGRYTSNTAIPSIDVTTGSSNQMPMNCRVSVSNQEVIHVFIIFCSGSDDLMFGCRRSIPQMKKTATLRKERDLPPDSFVRVVGSRGEYTFNVTQLKFLDKNDKSVKKLIEFIGDNTVWGDLSTQAIEAIKKKMTPVVVYDPTRTKRSLFENPTDSDYSDSN